MLLRLADQPQLLLIVIIAFVVAITIHEAAHALAATWLGDDLPKLQGRLTLNPMRHLDPLGTIMIAIASFGWGRPVIVNPYRLRYGTDRGMALVALAGPASNVALAVALTPIARQQLGAAPGDAVSLALAVIVQLNIFLAVFNLLPVPPLDGFSVLLGLAPKHLAEQMAELRRYGPFLLIGIFVLVWVIPQGTIIITGPANWITDFLLVS